MVALIEPISPHVQALSTGLVGAKGTASAKLIGGAQSLLSHVGQNVSAAKLLQVGAYVSLLLCLFIYLSSLLPQRCFLGCRTLRATARQ